MTEVMNQLREGLKDPEYRRGWIANISMSYKDCEYWYIERTGKRYLNQEDKHIIANEAAENFLKLLEL